MCVYVCMSVCVWYRCVYVWYGMYVCMYVCMYTYVPMCVYMYVCFLFRYPAYTIVYQRVRDSRQFLERMVGEGAMLSRHGQ